jgi:hypothetical protein
VKPSKIATKTYSSTQKSEGYIPPEDFIDPIIHGITEAESRGETTVSLTSGYLLYLIVFSKINKVGGIWQTYAHRWTGHECRYRRLS